MKNSNDKIAKFVKICLKIFHLKVSKETEKLFIQIFKFGLVGGTAFVIDFLFLYIFKEIFQLSIIISNTLSFIISLIYNYIASVKWVFEVNKNKDKRKNMIIFIVFSIIGLLLNDAIMWLSTNKLSIYYLFAKIIATIIVMIFNFITRKIFLE